MKAKSSVTDMDVLRDAQVRARNLMTLEGIDSKSTAAWVMGGI